MSGRLNMLAVGSNPKILHYLWRLEATNKLNIHLVNEEITQPEISLYDELNDSEVSFKPEICATEFSQLPKTKYDLVLLACKSLQDISNIASNLGPFLGKKSIIVLESTGFVNLEPFLKNCLPQELKLTVFSILSTVDIRKVSPMKFIIKNSGKREIILGESGTINSKYSSSAQQDLGALVKLLQYQQKDNLKVSSKNTYLEFLVEQWKLAMPRICFDPLLILFEEKNPEALTKQILAKPLLSGLVTELITVAKTMGCKLPVGYDNESNLLKRWTEDNRSTTKNSQVQYMDSPLFFYDFYHRNNLNIDMLLLQPILLADDHGIKTPYLEFLYATICQYDKLNSGSLFFKRDDGFDPKSLQQENDRLTVALGKQIDEYKKLLRVNEELQMQTRDLHSEKDTQLSQLSMNFEALQLEHQQMQQKYQQKSKLLSQFENNLQQAESRIQALQSQTQVVTAPQVQQTQVPVQETPAYPHQQQQTPRSVGPVAQLAQKQVSADGTPDLRDLADYAIYGAAIESPTRNAPQSDEFQDTPQAVTESAPPVLQLPTPPQQRQIQPQQQQQPILQQDGLSTRELELKKKEALLNSREMELNKKWSHLNGGRPQQLQPALQPMKQHRLGPQQQYMPQQQLPPQQQQFNGQQMGGMQMMPQQNRISTMPVMDEQLYGGMNRGGMNGGMNRGGAHNPQFKKASRKNRKSSFPLAATPGFNDNYSQLRPNGVPRHASMMAISNPIPSAAAPTSAGSMIPPAQGGLPSASQMNDGGAYSPTIKPNPQFQQQRVTKPSPNGSSHELNRRGSFANSTSSNEMLNATSTNTNTPINGNGISGNGINGLNGNTTADTSFGSVVINAAEDIEAKPLGSVGSPLGAIGEKKDKKKKKKFGMFGKK